MSYACKWGAVAATACMQRCWMDPPFLLARGQRCPTCCGARAGFFLPPAFFLGTPIVAASCRGCGCRVKWMEKAIQACLCLAVRICPGGSWAAKGGLCGGCRF